MADEAKLREYLRWVTADLHKAKQRLRELETGEQEPIAVIAMSCRLPGGVTGPADLWRLLVTGTDAISGFPTDRGWSAELLADSSFATEGGFLTDVHQFDPAFFGISPREALAMDPQQRLLLETAWESFERANIDIESLRGSRTGVFAGTTGQDYAMLLAKPPEGTEGYVLTGTAASVVSGRIAYTLGLEGPAISVDTACSTSLVALHLAVQALRAGECSLALAGGATVMATPTAFFGFDEQGGLAADGRCKTFAATADGTSWSEGAGMLLLERLSDARRNGHKVLAVVRASAVNSDGASNGLTAPNGPSQQRVILDALSKARLSPAQVDVVEAHGTGTKLGDPIEAEALLATYGQDRARPLLLGSLKSNVGHTQAAAGVSGVIKMVLAIQHGVLPKSLHITEPTPQVDWSAGAIELLTDQRDWPSTGEPRRGAVSAFGMSGTNAHVIIEQAPEPEPAEEVVAPVVADHPWLLSAKTSAALAGQVARLRAYLTEHPLPAADVARTLASRTTFAHRLAVLPGDLDSIGNGNVVPGPVRPVFVFPGQGAQWVGMAAGLIADSPVFAARLAECEAALAPHVDWSLTRALQGNQDLDRVDVVQPALWAVMVSLSALWQTYGVEPAAVVGHSQGEIAAAVVAGALSLEDGARVVALRSKAILALSGRGGMVSIAQPVDKVRELIAEYGERVSVAAVNGPLSVVISGAPEALDEIVASCEQAGLRAKKIPVDYASHSAQVEQIEAEIAEALAGLQPQAAQVPFCSAVTPGIIDTSGLDAGYWYRNLRQTVEFEQATQALIAAGHKVFIEVSPHPVLVPGLSEDVVGLGTLRRDEHGPTRFMQALADAHVNGVRIDWPQTGNLVDLPTYAFDRQRYWPEPPAEGEYTGVDAEFWSAVESADAAALAGTIELADPAALDAVLPALSEWRRRGQQKSTLDSWRYRVTWRQVDEPITPATGTWLAIVPANPVNAEFVDAVLGALPDVVRFEVAGDTIDQPLPVEGVSGVVNLLGTAQDNRTHAGVPTGLAATVALTIALETAGLAAPLWTVTSNGVSVGRADSAEDVDQAMLWGFGRVACLENPGWWGGLVDLPAQPDVRALSRFAAIIAQRDEDQVAVRPAGVLARRLVHAPLRQQADANWTPRGTVLITGGTGALGSFLARWLVREGAEHIVLASRRGMDAPGATELVAELEALGGRATVAQCDVADLASVRALVSSLDEVTAVIHTAGVSQLSSIAETSPDEFANVLTAKTLGARNLHEVFADRDLDAFVLFSSISGIWGSGGQGAYAAANTYLDALARQRRAAGLNATAVSWGAWGGAGMAKGSAEALLSRRGLPAMNPDHAIAALRQAVENKETTVTVADVRWERFVPTFTVLRQSPLLSDLPEVAKIIAIAEPELDGDTNPLRQSLTPKSPADRVAAVVDLVRAEAAGVLGYSRPEDLDTSRAFRELGFDSITAVDVRNRLVTATGVRLPTTVVFDYPTAVVLAEHIVAEVFGGTEDEPDAPVARRVDDDPIVIVGMACRYPGGVSSPEDLWDLVVNGRDAMGPFPTDRNWPLDELVNGSGGLGVGGFLYEAAEFDPGFFGISPREALAMDPQQRILLEVSWEAMERAGIDPKQLKGSRTAVFSGTNGQDYTTVLLNTADGAGAGVTSTAASILSGRISYTFGFEGPSATIDTGCSSSMVALHMAARALRADECSLALVNGVSVISTPFCFTEFTRQGALAGDGRCKAFADAADGTGWGEGVGVLVVERLSDARRNGHKVLAIVSGSAVNSDGASNGLTAPNGPSQRRVIRAALADAGVQMSEVDAVEAHGTGTALGDPIEAQALLATYGRDRAGEPLYLGSVKSNLGHTQAAAGVAGVIKMVQAMRHGVLPPTLHVDRPTTQVDWSAGTVELITEARQWPNIDRPRRVGVSSFGISGTNTHIILEQGDALNDSSGASDAPRSALAATPWVISGRTASGLRAQAQRLREWLDDDLDPRDIGAALDQNRALFEHRAVIVADTAERLKSGVDALIAGKPAAELIQGVAGPAAKPVFVFPGQGGQWAGMAVELLDTSPVFAERLAACEHALSEYVDWSLTEVLRSGTEWDRVDVLQPVLWAIMVSLAELWRAHGVEPAAVLGHSQGELAAACVAGALSLDDGARIVALRAKALLELAGHGGNLAVSLPVEDVRARLDGYGDRLGVATINGPSSVVVSGELPALDEFEAACTADGTRTSRVKMDYAAHSVQIENIRPTLTEIFADVTPKPGTVPFFSTVDVQWTETTELDAAYWWRNSRQTVEFVPAVAALAQQGHQVFIEISPHPVLLPGIQDTVADLDLPAVTAGSLRRSDGGMSRFLRSAAELATQGVPVDWTPLWSDARPVELPTYAFEHEHFWAQTRAAAADVTAAGLAEPGHPLLGAELPLAGSDQLVLTSRISLRTHEWLTDHMIMGTVLFPGAAFLELAIQAADRIGCARIEELTLEAPLVLPEHGAVVMQVAVDSSIDKGRAITIHSRPESGTDWTRHASGVLSTESSAPNTVDWSPSGTPIDLDGHYERLVEVGYQHGPIFQGLRQVWRKDAEILGEVALPEGVSVDGFGLHPALLDAALQAAGQGDFFTEIGSTWLPFSWQGVTLHATGAMALRVRARAAGDAAIALDLADPTGRPVATVEALAVRPVNTVALQAARGSDRDAALLRTDWAPVTGASPAGAQAVTVFEVARSGDSVVASTHALTADVLATLTKWLADEQETLLVIATRGAVSIGDEPLDLAHTAVWGLVRSAQSEHPGRFVLADIDDAPESAEAVRVAASPMLGQFAVRGGTVYAPSLTRLNAEPVVAEPIDGTVLITGGTGDIGALIAEQLVREHGVTDLILTSRSGPSAAKSAQLAELGAKVVAVDVTDPEALRELVTGIPNLKLVVHAAGVVDDGVLDALTPEQLTGVLKPKVDASWHLHELTSIDRPAELVFLSSAAGTFGGPAQANYAAANAFLDGLAQLRAAQGLPGVSIAWGPWAEIGKAAGLGAAHMARMSRSGFAPLAPEQGLALFDAARGAGEPVTLALRLAKPTSTEEVHPLLRPLFPAPARPTAQAAEQVGSLEQRIAGHTGAERRQIVVEVIRETVAAVLGLSSPAVVEINRGFMDSGFDSLSAVELRNRLNAITGLRLPATLIFDHPSPEALGRHIDGELGATSGGSALALLADLDRIAASVAGISPDDADRAKVAERLRGLLAAVGGGGGGSSDLDSATADEIFDLLDDELGLA